MWLDDFAPSFRAPCGSYTLNLMLGCTEVSWEEVRFKVGGVVTADSGQGDKRCGEGCTGLLGSSGGIERDSHRWRQVVPRAHTRGAVRELLPLRSSRMYDTLLQMGRWFGYRPGYVDLCRLYTTDELRDFYSHITMATDELRQEFDLMSDRGMTPQ